MKQRQVGQRIREIVMVFALLAVANLQTSLQQRLGLGVLAHLVIQPAEAVERGGCIRVVLAALGFKPVENGRLI